VNPPTDDTARRAEVAEMLFALQQAFEDLIVRGLESTGPDDLRRLTALGDELGRAGAAYLAERIAVLVHAVRERDGGAARTLLRAQTAARVFERVLSLDAAAQAFGGSAVTRDAAPAAGPAAGSTGAMPDRMLTPVLDELGELVEGLVGSGLTTATRATLDKLGATGKEASRLKLLRLATALRYVTDECGRFLAGSEQFSARRLAFFANRTWLLARGLGEAIGKDDRAAVSRLLLQSEPRSIKSLTVAVLGVHKRALLDGSAAFEFRLRTLTEASGVPRGARLVWSCVFGGRKDVPAEAFLHLPQPQKFAPRILLEPRQFAVTDAAVSLDEPGAGRLMLGPRSKVIAGAAFDRWSELATWDRDRAAARVAGHRISPLDLEVELQEDVVVADYELGEPAPNRFRSEQQVVPLRTADLELDAVIPAGRDGVELGAALDELRRARERPALYGVLHYEMARLVFQPLTALTGDGPRHLMISSQNIDLAALMKTMDFTT
jgi:hypothetical protein